MEQPGRLPASAGRPPRHFSAAGTPGGTRRPPPGFAPPDAFLDPFGQEPAGRAKRLRPSPDSGRRGFSILEPNWTACRASGTEVGDAPRRLPGRRLRNGITGGSLAMASSGKPPPDGRLLPFPPKGGEWQSAKREANPLARLGRHQAGGWNFIRTSSVSIRRPSCAACGPSGRRGGGEAGLGRWKGGGSVRRGWRLGSGR